MIDDDRRFELDGAVYEEAKPSLWRQVNPEPFEYDDDYKASQSTDVAMSWLRIGWLASHISSREMKRCHVVDIGSGNGEFMMQGQKAFKSIVSYDVCGESITKEELEDTYWDLVVLSDVLEHFKNIDYLFDLQWDLAFISYPELPSWFCAEHPESLRDWRHFKPNEHLWLLSKPGLAYWFAHNRAEPLAWGHFEDIIRKAWSETEVNITSVLVER